MRKVLGNKGKALSTTTIMILEMAREGIPDKQNSKDKEYQVGNNVTYLENNSLTEAQVTNSEYSQIRLKRISRGPGWELLTYLNMLYIPFKKKASAFTILIGSKTQTLT